MSGYCTTKEEVALRNLMTAVCAQAATDYRGAVRGKKRYEEKARMLVDKKMRGGKLTPAERQYLRRYADLVSQESQVTQFFTSQWGEALSGCDGKTVMEALRRDAHSNA